MTWAFVGLCFGLGFMAAVMLAVSGAVVLAACVSAIRGEEDRVADEIQGWEGTD